MSDLDESMPPLAWSEMDEIEREAAHATLQEVLRSSVAIMIADINAEFEQRGCPLRVRGSITVHWERTTESKT